MVGALLALVAWVNPVAAQTVCDLTSAGTGVAAHSDVPVDGPLGDTILAQLARARPSTVSERSRTGAFGSPVAEEELPISVFWHYGSTNAFMEATKASGDREVWKLSISRDLAEKLLATNEYALLWVLLHESAHAIHGHQTSSHRNERQADFYASDRLIEMGVSESELTSAIDFMGHTFGWHNRSTTHPTWDSRRTAAQDLLVGATHGGFSQMHECSYPARTNPLRTCRAEVTATTCAVRVWNGFHGVVAEPGETVISKGRTAMVTMESECARTVPLAEPAYLIDGSEMHFEGVDRGEARQPISYYSLH